MDQMRCVRIPMADIGLHMIGDAKAIADHVC